MPIYNYAIASGHDATSLDNIEDICATAPTSQPKEWGSVERRTLNQATQYNGTVIIEWKWDAISRTDFNTLLTYLGNVRLGSAPVTICTRDELDNWSIYNATMTNPLSKKGWQRAFGGYGAAEPLTIEFRIDSLTFDQILDEYGFPILDENGNIVLEG